MIVGFIWFVFCSLLLLGALAYLHLPRWGVTVLIGVYLLSQPLGWFGLLIWPAFLLISVVMHVPEWRLQFFSNRVFYRFFTQLPAMSQTEKEAIEAGDVGWEKELFQGNPQWEHFVAQPAPSLSQAEQAFLDNQVETLCAMLNDWEIAQETKDLPASVWEYLKAEKFFGMIIPKEYGGLAFSHYAHSCVIAKIGTRSVTAAVTVMVPNSLGPAELLLHYGSQAQRDHYLPRLATGDEIPCFALTGPEAGSDASAMLDTGVVCKGLYEGREILGIRLSFDKRYITLAPVATVFGLAFTLYDPDGLIGDKKTIGITVCLIPMTHPGVQSGKRHNPLNLAFMNGPIRGESVFVPLEWIIGGQSAAGQGWRMLVECLAAGRGISLPAMSTASGMLSTSMSGAYAAIRRQFNSPIGAFEGVSSALARIAGFTYLLQSTRLFVVGALDQGLRPSVATAIAKYHMTELSRKVINDAMDIHGGRGIMMGPSNYLARAYQSIPVGITVEGANILTRCLIIFGQGAIRCHPFIEKEMEISRDYKHTPAESLKEFDTILQQHIGYSVGNFCRTLFLSLSRGHLYWGPIKDERKAYVKKINYLSAAFAFSADVAMLMLGGALKRKENISGRLGDILSQLYLASATLKYYGDHEQPKEEWPLAEWALQTCLYEAQEAFITLFENFPSRVVGGLLQWIVFPYGRAFSRPKDKLSKQVAQSILTPSAVRKRLTALCYLGEGNDATRVVAQAFEEYAQIQPIFDKISQAVKEKTIKKKIPLEEKIAQALTQGLIDQAQAQQLLSFEKLRKKVIAVDEFNADAL